MLTLCLCLSPAVGAKEVTKLGTPGPPGINGKAGDPGKPGTDGEKGEISPAKADYGDPVNVAIADGRPGPGGSGGSGGPGSPQGENDKDADGGNGGRGGSVTSSYALAVTDWSNGIASDNTVRAEARSWGGDGGQGGPGGSGAGNGQDGKDANAGAGAAANAIARAEHQSGPAHAAARSNGGRGGSATGQGNGGRGGDAPARAVASTGEEADATAEASAQGGNGGGVTGINQVDGAGLGGAGGAASAVAGANTQAGDATARAEAQGGAAGSGGASGAPGKASAQAFARNSGPGKVTVQARSRGGSGGTGKIEGGKGAGAAASGIAISDGGGDVSVDVNVAGGDGPGGGAGASLDNAARVQTTGAAQVRQTARGGSGYETVGGSASSTLSLDHPGKKRLQVDLEANGGSGKQGGGNARVEGRVTNVGEILLSGTGRGGNGGSGGAVSVGPIFAESTGNEPVTVRAWASGGSGSTPATATLENAVDGETSSVLQLEQHVYGGNGADVITDGGAAKGALSKSAATERLWLLVDSRGGDGWENGNGARADSVIGGENTAGELIIRGESLGGAGGRSVVPGSGGAAAMTVDARVGPDGGPMDVIVEANGGPGGKGGIELSDETRADIEQRRPGFDWEGAYGRGGGAATSVTAVSDSKQRVRVQAQATGGGADPEGLFGGDGGEAKAEVLVTALASGDLDLDAQARGGASRDGGSAGSARAIVEAQARGRIDASADAIAGAGEDAQAVATTSASGTSGGVIARAGIPFGDQDGGPHLLTGRVTVRPGDLLTRDATDAIDRLGPLAVTAAAGAESEAEVAGGGIASLAVTPYPPGEPDALFAVAISARHPLDEATAKVYRDGQEPQLKRLAQPLAVTIDLQWPTGAVVADYLARGTRLEMGGTGAPLSLALTGLEGSSKLGSTDTGTGEGPTLETIFEERWNLSELLAGDDRSTRQVDGLTMVFSFQPGDLIDGRLVISRADH